MFKLLTQLLSNLNLQLIRNKLNRILLKDLKLLLIKNQISTKQLMYHQTIFSEIILTITITMEIITWNNIPKILLSKLIVVLTLATLITMILVLTLATLVTMILVLVIQAMVEMMAMMEVIMLAMMEDMKEVRMIVLTLLKPPQKVREILWDYISEEILDVNLTFLTIWIQYPIFTLMLILNSKELKVNNSENTSLSLNLKIRPKLWTLKNKLN